MKNLIIAGLVMFLGLFSTQTFAQTDMTSRDKMEMQDDKNKTSIAVSELPAPVRTALASDAHAGWEAKEAWKITKDDGAVYYKVNAVKGSAKTTLKFDSNGNIVDKKDKDKRSKS